MIFSPLNQKSDVMPDYIPIRLVPRYHNCDRYIMCQFIFFAKGESHCFIFCGFSNELIYRLFVGILILVISLLTAISHTLLHTMETGETGQAGLRQINMLS